MVIHDDLAGETGKAQMPISSSWGTWPRSLEVFVTGSHLSYPARASKSVVREPVEEDRATVVMPAPLGLPFITLVPLEGIGMRRHIPCRNQEYVRRC